MDLDMKRIHARGQNLEILTHLNQRGTFPAPRRSAWVTAHRGLWPLTPSKRIRKRQRTYEAAHVKG
jgi:hypothetical protein